LQLELIEGVHTEREPNPQGEPDTPQKTSLGGAPMRDNLAPLLDDFRRLGRETAVVRYKGNRRRVTSYGELARLAGRFAALLEARGVKAGDRVLIWGENGAEWIAAFHGCMLRGVLAVPLDFMGTAEFAARVAADVKPMLAVGDAALLSNLDLDAPKIDFETWLDVLPPYFRFATADSVHVRHHGRPQGDCAHAWQRTGEHPADQRGRATLPAL